MDFPLQLRGAESDQTDELIVASPARRVRHIALLGNFLPRRCGIATFTTDTYEAFATRYPGVQVDVWAMNDTPGYDYPEAVTGEIEQDDPVSYSVAAQAIESSGADLLWVQHEFGIFGGSAGEHIIHLIEQVSMPVTITLHTVLERPDAAQRRVMHRLIARADQLIVMAEKGRELLIHIYGVPASRILVIPHGIPDRPFAEPDAMKAKFGFGERPVILTFGLLSPGKGIETMISAMPEIVAAVPDALYVVLGATHPHLIATHGEEYRDRLCRQGTDLGVRENVRFIDAFVETEELLDYLSAADIYATPYLNPAQVTSGTLAYAVGLGKAVVSTPYVHAKELLSGGHGCLVDFADSAGFASAIVSLLGDRARLNGLRARTYALGRTMIWPRMAETALAGFEMLPAHSQPERRARPSGFKLSYSAVERMTDATGMMQHSVYGVPDRAHGYCVDDNARALILACRAPGIGPDIRARWTATYAAFVQHAWNPDLGVFRNFMSFDRRWLEEKGSDDSVGRTIWALGVAANEGHDEATRQWATGLFDRSIGFADTCASPRTLAFAMLGAVSVIEAQPGHHVARALIARAGQALANSLHAHCRPDWAWFEIMLAYDNCRLPEALIRGGRAIGRDDLVATGIETLEWIVEKQTARGGWFRPVGHESFGRPYADPLPFDQQPVEAWAMIDACAAAYAETGDTIWKDRATSAWNWFLGQNDRGIMIADPATGECFDGLTPSGANLNRGAESVLAFQLSAVAMAQLAGLASIRSDQIKGLHLAAA